MGVHGLAGTHLEMAASLPCLPRAPSSSTASMAAAVDSSWLLSLPIQKWMSCCNAPPASSRVLRKRYASPAGREVVSFRRGTGFQALQRTLQRYILDNFPDSVGHPV